MSGTLQPKQRRSGAITLGDLAGRLDLLRVGCSKCARAGQYRVTALIERYGPDMGLPDWKDAITADCPRRAKPGATWGPLRRPLPRLVVGGVGPLSGASARDP
jgi:hypothetical protein